MKTSIACLVVLLVVTAAIAQPPDTVWTQTVGGPDSDYGVSVCQTNDGGFITVGKTDSYGAGGADVYLVRTDSDGGVLWTRTFGDSYNDFGTTVIQTTDGGFAIAGHTWVGHYDVWLIKTDAQGIESWNNTYGGEYDELGFDLQQSADGGYIITGSTESYGAGLRDAWLLKTDSLGVSLWNHTFGGIDHDVANCVRETADGGYVLTGKSRSFSEGFNDVWLIKTNSIGNEIWTQTFGGVEDDEGYCVEVLLDGGYIIVGNTRSFGSGETDVWLIQTDDIGTEIWNQAFGGAENDYGYSVKRMNAGGYIISGQTNSFGLEHGDAWLIRTDSFGNEVWSENYGGPYGENGRDIQPTDDEGYIVTGYTDLIGGGGNFDAWLIRIEGELLRVLSPNGGEEWRQNSEHDIRWQSSSMEDVIIELMEGAVVERVISEGTPNDGVFEWSIPNDIIPGNNFYIKCTLADGSEEDLSNGPFTITALPSVTLTPFLPPVIIDDFGGGFWYWTEISNNSPYPGTGQYWTEVVLPNGYTFGPLTVNGITLGAFETFAPAEPSSQWVPSYAPAGIYEFVMKVGIQPNVVVATDSFEFEKLAGASTVAVPESNWSVADWQNEAWELMRPTAGQTVQVPNSFNVSSAYPNPFNPSTTISVNLPEPAELTVTVFNIAGQRIATLTDGLTSSGQHQFIFDAIGLASGLYFIHATIPGQLDDVQRVLLVQ